MKKELSFEQDLRKAASPKQTYSVFMKHMDRTFAQLGTILLASNDEYVEKTCLILKADRFRQKLDKNNHRTDALTKANAKKLFVLLNKYANKAVKAL